MKKEKFISAAIIAMFFSQTFAADFSVSFPEGAGFFLGTKSKHFVDFEKVEPVEQSIADGVVTYNYNLISGKVYNYRTWKENGLTNAGYFTMNSDASKCPVLSFKASDYALHSPVDYNHDVQSNNGYETGDIFLNINPQGHLRLKSGQSFDAHAMRTWELTDNAVNNYFIEPDFHYSVIGLYGKTADEIITIDETPGSAWAEINAHGPGTAIVLVTYDGINLNYYSGATANNYLGGSYWGAVWPENTGIFVVTVDDAESDAVPNMLINENYNAESKKISGIHVDAEHDVFYYLKGQEGHKYSFKPANVKEITVAYPDISSGRMSFDGFSSEGITDNGDGSYTVLLKEGRQIVKLTDFSGNSVYQVLTAKECERTVSNASRPGSTLFQPGDKVEVRYKGLRHPANKIAGIYNMSAYITYNGTPAGTSLIQTANQYTFGSSEAAQTLTAEIPDDFDVDSNARFVLSDGVIQVTGFGDPIGNHRTTQKDTGRSPNLNAVSHQTYFGYIPDVEIEISPVRYFSISIDSNTEDAEISIVYNDEKLLGRDADGRYKGSFGKYKIIAKKPGYRCFRSEITLGEEDDTEQVFHVDMIEGTPGMWDGTSATEVIADEKGVYHVTLGDQLSYLAAMVNQYSNKITPKIVLDSDIDLGDYDWTPIGNGAKTYFSGEFDGLDHEIKGLYIDNSSMDYAGLFGNVQGLSASHASVSNVRVRGYVGGKQYVGGIVAKADKYSSVERCANLADISGSSYVGGVVGYLSASTQCSLRNCYNTGKISGQASVGGVIGYNNKSAVIENIFSTGEVTGSAANSTGACVGGTAAKDKVTNAYAVQTLDLDDKSLVVSGAKMASGEIAWLLGDAFTQTIGEHPHPVFNGLKVYYDNDEESYYNFAVAFEIDLGEGKDQVEVGDGILSMIEESEYQLKVKAVPAAARLPEISWSSSNPSVVSVDDLGVVRALTVGSAVISATGVINATPVTASCPVMVLDDGTVSVSDIESDMDANIDIYDMAGRKIRSNASLNEIKNLAPGLYIFRSAAYQIKVLIKD